MGRVWHSQLDPRDYRMKQQAEQYEGPAFKEMMSGTTPEGRFKDMLTEDTTDSRSRAWDINPQPARQPKKKRKHWYERIERTYYN